MRGLASVEHNAIRDVDHIVEWTNAARFDSSAQPVWTPADFYVLNSPGRIEWTFALSRNRDLASLLGLKRQSFGLRNSVRYNILPRHCRDFAGQAEVTEQIAAIWCDFDIEDRVGWKYLANWRADSRFRR